MKPALVFVALLMVAYGWVWSIKADAAPPRDHATEITAGLLVADAFFGRAPACGTPTVSWERPSPNDQAYAVKARSLGWVIGHGEDCTIHLNTQQRWVNPGDLCTTVVHEYGHLLGLEHGTDVRDPMYPTLERTFPPCGRRVRAHVDRWVRVEAGRRWSSVG